MYTPPQKAAFEAVLTADGTIEIPQYMSAAHVGNAIPRALVLIGSLGGGTLNAEITHSPEAAWTTSDTFPAVGTYQVYITGLFTRLVLSGSTSPNLRVVIH